MLYSNFPLAIYFTYGNAYIIHDQPRQHIKEQRHYFAKKGPSSQSYGSFSRQTIQYHSNPSLCLTSNVEEAEWLYEDLQDPLELTPKKEMSFSL